MRQLLIGLCILCGTVTSATAQVSIGIGLPGVSIGINLPLYPELVQVPGYPVHYAPRLNSNYFFYDGMYWVLQGDNWYASSWYNGPWSQVGPQYVPVYLLRVPVRYYRAPPPYFRGWRADAPPQWGQHYGHDWEQQRKGWSQWDRHAVPAPAPLPAYQRSYSGDRYPHEIERQQALRSQNYGYQPRDPVVRQVDQRAGPPPRTDKDGDRPAAKQEPSHGQGQGQGQAHGQGQGQGQGKGQEKGGNKGDERGQEHK
jgi:hypothetical protein